MPFNICVNGCCAYSPPRLNGELGERKRREEPSEDSTSAVFLCEAEGETATTRAHRGRRRRTRPKEDIKKKKTLLETNSGLVATSAEAINP